MTRWSARIAAELATIESIGQWRFTRSFDALGQRGRLGDAPMVSFAGNDYLGLSEHAGVVDASIAATRRWGTSATAARLIVGTRPVHDELEAELAEWKQTEAAVVFSTGYQANVGVLSTLGTRGTTIVSDSLNHASIVDGCRLGRADVAIFDHGDLRALDGLLAAVEGPTIVVADSVFSMDGDVVPIDDIAEICGRHESLLIVDEAHAVLGPHLVPDDLPCDVVRVGTLSKTLGALGGFVAGSRAVIDLLVNRARSFIFTTGLSPADAAAALAALRIVRSPEGEALAARLRANIDRVVPAHPSPIIPVIVGDERAALAASVALADHGLWVPAVRPPTVPAGTSRLRIAISAAHTDDDLDTLVSALAELGLEP